MRGASVGSSIITHLHGIDRLRSIASTNRLDWGEARIKDLGAHPYELDRDRHLFATTEGMGDLANTEAGMQHLVTHLPAPTGSWPCLTSPHRIRGGR